MKVMSIVGTRPEIIKMSAIIKKFDEHLDHIFVHTGQNYDYELNEIFYKDLMLRKPDHFLNVAGDSLGETLGAIFFEVEKVLKLHEPDAVVILGDTNSALGGFIAKRMKIPLFHLEAGNRCFDENVPEEINRKVMDHIADVNMVYSENSRRYLLDEGVAKERIFLMGSPIKEVIMDNIIEIQTSTAITDLGLTDDDYFLVSLHRDENTEIKENLDALADTLNELVNRYETPVILSTHPRLRKKIDAGEFVLDERIKIMKPFGFFDYLKLQMGARCVISDSGTIAEESAILGFPAVTIRNAIERPEALDAGSLIMSGVDKKDVFRAIGLSGTPTEVPQEYDIDNTSERVLRIVTGYTPYVNRYVWRKK